MSFGNATETDLLKLLFNNIAFAGVGDTNGLQPSATAGSYYVRLHTADPGEAGTGDTNQANYTGYAPVAVARTVGGFTVAGDSVSNAALVQFGECSAGSNVVTHFSITTTSGAAAQILVSGTLGASRTITSGITPLFNAGALTGTVN
jgi:hypothetical protein